MDNKLLTVYQYAEYKNLTHKTVYRWLEKGMPFIRGSKYNSITMINIDDAQAWLETQKRIIKK